jgi:hypothetical protein
MSGSKPLDILAALSLPLPPRLRKQAPPPTGDKRTTLMIKNLPNRYSRAMVIALLESKLPVGSFDFVYVPIDFATRQNFAYAFVNLSTPNLVKTFFALFAGFRFPEQASKAKMCEVVFARVQGIEANVNRLINSPILTACSQGDPYDTALPLVYTPAGEPVRFAELFHNAVIRENALLAWTPRPPPASLVSSPVLTPSAGDEGETAQSWITDTLIKEMMTLLDNPLGTPDLSGSPALLPSQSSSIYYDLSTQLP